MSLHESITVHMQQRIVQLGDCSIISPTALAAGAYSHFASGQVEPHIEYTSLEHFKSIARAVLAGRFSDKGEDNDAYADQGELFSGVLQERYPLPRLPGEEPRYKKRCDLTADERHWNVVSLRKSANARLLHADALEAEGLSETAAA